jgi:hypothetical protein
MEPPRPSHDGAGEGTMSAGNLSKAELASVSGRARIDAQEAWYKSEGIPCKRNGRGELVVLWAHVKAWLEGRPAVRSSEPDFSSLGG